VQDRVIIVIPGRRAAASPESIFQRPVCMFSAAGVHGFRASPLGRSRNDMDGHKSGDIAARLV
jgi:hypothetical protein